jgi:hypothetical protein
MGEKRVERGKSNLAFVMNREVMVGYWREFRDDCWGEAEWFCEWETREFREGS